MSSGDDTKPGWGDINGELYDRPGRDGPDAGRDAPAAHDRSPKPAPVLNAISGPNGKDGTLVTCWLTETRAGDGVPRLAPTWAQPHHNKETGQ